jgi:hypothetical protein
VIENMRSAIENFQITYDATPTQKEASLKVENLPVAWSLDLTAPVVDCLKCPGRLGYTIQPFDGMRGLYLVTVRVTHTDWTEAYRDYEFVVGAK